jgi:hypothetical protein
MSAQPGNNTAEKWTIEKTEEVLAHMEEYAHSLAMPLIGQALYLADLYPDLWAYLKRKWKDNDEIYGRMKKVELQFENKLLLGALKKELHGGTAALALKTKYGYSERKQTSVNEKQAPPPKPTLGIIENTKHGDFVLYSADAVSHQLMIYSMNGELYTSIPITENIQRIQLSSPPEGHYNLYIKGPVCSDRKFIYIEADPEQNQSPDETIPSI